ncbi:decaprenyl-phosphate phosphoribosyltransferase [Candidatus Gottesmanbacteria bacterium]|nr:decaprenyl-phosphate phosphoribosyltransferase [Candidatus Gottesmanbacteria bacterium]
MVKIILALIYATRPRQWIKNLAVFAASIFTGQLFNGEIFKNSLSAFIIFCALSAATYLFNDVIDVKRDRFHPVKKLRPVASGTLPIPIAMAASLVLALGGLYFAAGIIPTFFLISVLYLVLQLSYTLFLKNIAVLDILAIASGYILRVLGGEFATGFHVTFWLLICVISLSLFLAIGKRRAELTLLSGFKPNTRPSLGHYSDRLLDIYLSMFANSTWFSYALFTFLEPPIAPRNRLFFYIEDLFPSGLTRKWLVITIPFVIYGLMRYAQLIYEKKEGESPEKVVLGDRPLLATVVIWILLVIFLIYLVRH